MVTRRRSQKGRTRDALLEAARDLIAAGQEVTVASAAAASGISRATAYRYFSDGSVLAAEAGLSIEVADYAAIVAGCATPKARLVAVSLYFFDLALERELPFRLFLSQWLAAWRPGGGGVTRGARRVAMFRQALGDDGDRMDAAAREDLVRALSATTGVEAMIGLMDVARADSATARRMVAHIAETLIDAAARAPADDGGPASAPRLANPAGP